MRDKVKFEASDISGSSMVSFIGRLPVQSAPVIRNLVNSGLAGDALINASDWNDSQMPVNYFVHVQ